MSRYIDAEDFKSCTLKFGEEENSQELAKWVCAYIDCFPTADVAEVKHGEWKSGKTPNGLFGYYCSICTASFVGENAEWIAKEHRYCPKCGAKMDGERRTEE